MTKRKKIRKIRRLFLEKMTETLPPQLRKIETFLENKNHPFEKIRGGVRTKLFSVVTFCEKGGKIFLEWELVKDHREMTSRVFTSIKNIFGDFIAFDKNQIQFSDSPKNFALEICQIPINFPE